ncbi:MAG: NADH-quinone oxidoreductase subunit E, partial [Lapillicoccus sp.]
ACDYAPVVMANWEFFDNQTIDSTKRLVDDLRAGERVRPTRGADSVVTFKQVSRVLAGFDDGRADEGVGAGDASLAGLRLAHRRGWNAPSGAPGKADELQDQHAPDASPEGDRGGIAPGRTSSTDSPSNDPDKHPGDQPAGEPTGTTQKGDPA